MDFVVRLRAGERMSDLCREFGISRKTGYKIASRFERLGTQGLHDLSRRPKRLARQLPVGIQNTILELKREWPTWGAAKILEVLRRKHPSLDLPVRSTVHDLLDRHGLVQKRAQRRRFHAYPTLRDDDVRAPNQLWCTDFKGQFRMKNSKYCYPLTVSDFMSRYLLGCEAMAEIKTLPVLQAFELIFREFGLPDRMRSDNGPPFSSRSVQGLSQLSAWWMRLGIQLERIEPGQPQQNGRHERMHRTLKAEVAPRVATNLLQQQERLDEFRAMYNDERPHEALKMRCPAEVYRPSRRPFPDHLPDPSYPEHTLVKQVSSCGSVHFKGKEGYFYLGQALAYQPIALEQEDDQIWRVSFMDLDLGFLDEATMKFVAISPEESSLRLSHQPS
jgi:putative transposase